MPYIYCYIHMVQQESVEEHTGHWHVEWKNISETWRVQTRWFQLLFKTWVCVGISETLVCIIASRLAWVSWRCPWKQCLLISKPQATSAFQRLALLFFGSAMSETAPRMWKLQHACGVKFTTHCHPIFLVQDHPKNTSKWTLLFAHHLFAPWEAGSSWSLWRTAASAAT